LSEQLPCKQVYVLCREVHGTAKKAHQQGWRGCGGAQQLAHLSLVLEDGLLPQAPMCLMHAWKITRQDTFSGKAAGMESKAAQQPCPSCCMCEHRSIVIPAQLLCKHCWPTTIEANTSTTCAKEVRTGPEIDAHQSANNHDGMSPKSEIGWLH
jgi:hypothetical protein